MDFQEFKEDVKEFFTKYKKKIIPIAGGVVAIIVLAVVLTSVFSHREEKRIPFDDIHVYDRLQSYSSSETFNAYDVGSLYTKCGDDVAELHSYYNKWPEGIMSHKVTDETAEEKWTIESTKPAPAPEATDDTANTEDGSAAPTEDAEPVEPTEETPAEADTTAPADTPAEEAKTDDANTDDTDADTPKMPDLSELPFDITKIDEDAFGWKPEYVLYNDDYCTLMVTKFVDLPGVGFEMYSTLTTGEVPSGASFESTIHLSQYWEKEHAIVKIDALESNTVYEIHSIIVTDDWDEDVNIVYMATTSTLTKPSADNASEIVNCEMSEIFDLSYKKDIKVEAPDYSDIEDPIL